MTTIRNAFTNAFCTGELSPLHLLVAEALKRKQRLSRDQQRGWSTKISFRTYNSLKNQGVLD